MRAVRAVRVRRWSWIVMAAVILVSLLRATVDSGPPRTTAEQVQAIASTMKCPVCKSQSVADSDVAASRSIRLEIARLVEEGQSPAEIRRAIGATYGDQIQLIPPAAGFAGLVWALPVIGLVLAIGALSTAFARWRRRTSTGVSDDDRALVDEALARR